MTDLLLPDSTTPRPFPPSYWIVPGRLLAGPSPWLRDVDARRTLAVAMLDCGVRGTINLMQEAETVGIDPSFSSLFSAEHLARFGERPHLRNAPILDMGVPTREMMRSILDTLDELMLRTEGAIYLHCRGGFGRTGTVAGCWLARHGYAHGDEVLHLLQSLRAPSTHASYPSPETDTQRSLVTGWNRGE